MENNFTATVFANGKTVRDHLVAGRQNDTDKFNPLKVPINNRFFLTQTYLSHKIDENYNITITSLDNSELEETTVESKEPLTQVKDNIPSSKTFTDSLKTVNDNQNSRLDMQNELIKNQNDILAEANRINAEMVNSIKQQTQSIKALVENNNANSKAGLLQQERFHDENLMMKSNQIHESWDTKHVLNNHMAKMSSSHVYDPQTGYYAIAKESSKKSKEKNESLIETLEYDKKTITVQTPEGLDNIEMSPREFKALSNAQKMVKDKAENETSFFDYLSTLFGGFSDDDEIENVDLDDDENIMKKMYEFFMDLDTSKIDEFDTKNNGVIEPVKTEENTNGN